MKDNKKDALDYHEFPQPGKIAVVPTKKHASQYDLSLAYSPGVAEPCLAMKQTRMMPTDRRTKETLSQ